MQSASTRIIANPAAAGGRGRREAERLRAALDEPDLRWTEAPGHAAELAAEAALDGVARIVVVGGDGTMHEVAAGLLRSGADPLPPVALHPAGTGNDFHRMVGAPRGVGATAALLGEGGGAVERFDAGRVRWDGGEEIFVNLLGVGVDVDILRCRARFARLPGLLQYLAAFLNAMAAFRPPRLAVDVPRPDGARIRGGATLATITVGPSIGGGFMISPAARRSDGKLDLCHIAALRWRDLPVLVPKVIRGAHAGSRLVEMRQLTEARIRREDGEPFWFEIDGELAPGPARELRVGVLPGALPVIVPADA